ncbi:ATP-binding cassette domain-containing protein [Tenacibaculum sp. AHE15PA]|uniref:ATP-binding cassette domain-containing protein n=1 Tax=unclassified Tenacibaculum TaxID=2635139 RepID=UPI001C4F154E|nr:MULTISPECIES: ATP-binding cassette domain-containing protein [unclassified Tenacibaculum]QXP72544.1 ATP-binding cassette domain-containing protein [Tenacibaculum sp. AHE14PA]QXP76459.1 ATP-binding cassette domain-containing protein [Tenacibaculum sp. AHE15PA]
MDCLEIDNIELNFGTTEILKAIYFKAEKGKITGVLGSNGSGKTSLLRIIFGELLPKSKLLRIDSKPILTPLYKKRIVKYLPQFHIIPNTISLQEGFKFFNASFTDFLTDFPHFKSQKQHRFSEFSGGEKRLIETYIILKSDAKIVLFDEPFSHLAPLYIKKLKEVLEIEKQHKIIIITDHLYQDILDISDTMYLLKDGWSRLLKSPEELIQYNYINAL